MDTANDILTASKLRALSEEVKRQKGDAVSKLAEEVYNYINSTYKSLAQKAIMQNANCKGINFKFPSNIGKRLIKLDDDSLHSVREYVKRKMQPLGFEVKIKHKGFMCEDCLFSGWVCNRMFKAYISWD
jgi:phenylalanyl-tRNA synthetase alpha subunit